MRKKRVNGSLLFLFFFDKPVLFFQRKVDIFVFSKRDGPLKSYDQILYCIFKKTTYYIVNFGIKIILYSFEFSFSFYLIYLFT